MASSMTTYAAVSLVAAQRPLRSAADLDGHGRAVGEVGERGAEPRLGQDGREDAVRELAQLVERTPASLRSLDRRRRQARRCLRALRQLGRAGTRTTGRAAAVGRRRGGRAPGAAVRRPRSRRSSTATRRAPGAGRARRRSAARCRSPAAPLDPIVRSSSSDSTSPASWTTTAMRSPFRTIGVATCPARVGTPETGLPPASTRES